MKSHGKLTKPAHTSPGKRPRPPQRRQNWQPLGLILVGVILLGVVFIISSSPTTAQNDVVPPRMGATMSRFVLNDLEGRKVDLRDYAGQVVLINAWATWCPPCTAEMPDLNTYYQAHKDEGFVVLAINAGDPSASVIEFARNYQLSFPVLIDPNSHLLNQLRIRSFPTSIVIGRDGKVKNIHIGMYLPEDLEADITPLLAQ